MASTPTSTDGAFGRQPGTYPRLSTVRSPNPNLKAVLSKLVTDTTTGDRHSSTSQGPTNVVKPLDLTLLQHISGITGSNVQDASSLFQLLPDTELGMQILVSSILSPKDLVTTQLTYKVDPSAFNSPVAGMLIDCLKDYFENTYKIKELNPKILQDCLFFTGSYPLLILPENSIDDVINSTIGASMEAMREVVSADGTLRPMGFLGAGSPKLERTVEKVDGFVKQDIATPSQAVSMESLLGFHPQAAASVEVKTLPPAFDGLIKITDNFNVLKMPYLQERIRDQRTQNLLAKSGRSFGVESMEAQSRDESLYRARRYRPTPVLAIKGQSSLKRPPTGHPLVMKLPSEAVIPVHMPANPDQHLGYFVLLDPAGNPLSRALESDYYTDLTANLNANNDMASQLIATTRRMEMGRETARTQETQELQRIFDELVEQDFLARLKNGVYGDNVEISHSTDMYRIMLARSMKKMVTQVLYIPKELMTYIAFEYNRYGVGTSLIQNAKIIGGIRAMLLFANTMAAIKNSVGREQLNIQLSEKDPQPTKTVQFLIHEYAKTRQASYPLGASNPIDIISFLQNAAVNVAVTGNTGFPEVKFDVEDKQSNHTKVDKELEDSLRDRYLMALGLSPETVVNGSNAEFATTIVTQNLLLTKRVMVYQASLTAFLKDFIQKYTRNSGTLMDDLRRLVKDHLKAEEDAEKAKAAEDAKLNKEAEQAAADKAKEAQAAPAEPVAATPAEGDVGETTTDGEEGTDLLGDTTFEAYPPTPETNLPNAAEFKTFQNQEGLDMDVEKLLLEFLDAIEVSLPAPDTATLKNQMESYDQYSEAMDKALDVYLNTTFLTQSGLGEVEGLVDEVKAGIKAYYMRQWMRSNNVLPELDDLVMLNDQGEPELDMMNLEASHVEAMGKSILNYIRTLLENKAKSDAKYEAIAKMFGADIEPPSGGSDFGGGDTGGDFGGGDDGLGGGDDLGGDFGADATTDIATPDETPATDAEPTDDKDKDKDNKDKPKDDENPDEETPAV